MDYQTSEKIRAGITPANVYSVRPVQTYIDHIELPDPRSRITAYENEFDKFKLYGAGLVKTAIDRGCYDLHFVTIGLKETQKPHHVISNFVRSWEWPDDIHISYLAVSVPAGPGPGRFPVTDHVHIVTAGIPLTMAAQDAAASFWNSKQSRKHKSFDGQIVYYISGLYSYLAAPRNLGMPNAKIHASTDVRAQAGLIAKTGPEVLKDCLKPIELGFNDVMFSGKYVASDFCIEDRAPYGHGMMRISYPEGRTRKILK